MALHKNSAGFLILLGCLVGLSAFTIDINLPAIPALAEAFGTSALKPQLTISLYLIGFAVGQLACGPLSDRFGRRPLILVGIVIFTISSVAAGFATDIDSLITARFFQGVGACTGPILGRAIVRDLWSGNEAARMLSYITAIMAIGPILAPIIGAYLLTWLGWPSIFHVLTIIGICLLIALSLALPETIPLKDPRALQPQRILANYRRFLTNPDCLPAALILALAFTGLFAFIAGAPLIFIDGYGMDERLFGWVLGGNAVAYLGGSWANASLTRRYEYPALLRIGIAITTLAALGFGALAIFPAPPLLAILAAMFLFTLGTAFIGPNATVIALQPVPHMAGAAASILGIMQMGFAGLVTALVGYFYDGTAFGMNVTVAVTGLITLVVYLASRPGLGRQQP